MHTDTEPELTRQALTDQVEEFARLARWYAERGDTRRAVLATWAADVRLVQQALWEGGLHAAPDVAHALGTAGEAVVAAAAAVSEAGPSESLRGLVESARRSVAAGLASSLRDSVLDAFVELDHLDQLDQLPSPGAGAANAAVTERLAGRSGEQLVEDLLTAAADSRRVARVLADVGDEEGARGQEAAALLAGFEAYLVLSSAASGDATLATADLRWDLAALQVEPAGSGYPDRLREVMHGVVAPAEREALRAVLDLSPERVDA